MFTRDILPHKSLNSNSSEWVTLATRIPGHTYVVENLEGGKLYTFLVRAENSHGLSTPSPLSEPISLNTEETLMEPTIEDKQTREARALLQSGHTAELIDIQSFNSTSIKLTWEVSSSATLLIWNSSTSWKVTNFRIIFIYHIETIALSLFTSRLRLQFGPVLETIFSIFNPICSQLCILLYILLKVS